VPLLRGRRAVLRRAIVIVAVVIAALVTMVSSVLLREGAQAQSRGGDEKSQRERKPVHESSFENL
jgi:hypothetical protein